MNDERFDSFMHPSCSLLIIILCARALDKKRATRVIRNRFNILSKISNFILGYEKYEVCIEARKQFAEENL